MSRTRSSWRRRATCPISPNIADPEKELSPHDYELLNRTVRYAFASEHTDRVNMWYEQLLPNSRMLARCRSFESALAFVEMGLGTAIVPELAVHQNGRPLFDVTLYSVPLPHRKTLLVAPDHYFALPHLKAFLGAFADCSSSLARPEARPVPHFAAKRLAPEAADAIALAATRHRRRLSRLSLEDPARCARLQPVSSCEGTPGI